MKWEKKIKEFGYDAAKDVLVRMCNMHNIQLYKHTDNYIYGTAICVLSRISLDIGLPYYSLSRESKREDNWYISLHDYELFIKL